jgi:hypothetical protein
VATTVYFVIGSELDGAVHDTVADLIPGVASVISGASGSPDSVTGEDGVDGGPNADATEFFALTVNS